MMSTDAGQASSATEQEKFGVVITGTFAGQVVGAVYSPETEKVYLLPKNLFEVDKKLAREAGLSRSRMLKMEENLAFGECVRFFANEYNIVMEIIGHGRQPEFFRPQMIDGHLTLKVLGAVSKEHQVWTEHLGFVEYPEDTVLPLHDVPIECFVLCDYSIDDPFVVKFSLRSFGTVDHDATNFLNHTPWHIPEEVFVDFVDPDDSEDEMEAVYRQVPALRGMLNEDDGQLPQYGVIGILFFDFIYCAETPNRRYHRVFSHQLSDTLQPGTLVRFDAYYSEVHKHWIAYRHDVRLNIVSKTQLLRLALQAQPMADPNPVHLVFPTIRDNGQMTMPADLSKIPLLPGVLENTHLSHVSDRRGVFSTLVPMNRSSNSYRATVAFLGFVTNRVCHFETISAHSSLLMQSEYAPSLNCVGYIADNEIICPMHLNVLFTVNFTHDVPPGTCVEFEALLESFMGGRVAYSVNYFDQAPAFCEKYDLDVTKVEGMSAIICNAYLNTCRHGDIWLSPLFGPVEDVHNIITGKRTTDGKKATKFRVVIVRDRKFNRSSTMFYIHSLAPEGRIEKFQYEQARIEDLIGYGKSHH